MPTPETIQAIRAEVGENQYRVYHPQNMPPGIIHSAYLEKCSCVVVGTSGSWLFALPHRVDRGKGDRLVFDIDPFIVMEIAIDTPAPSGMFEYHGSRKWNHQEIPCHAGENIEMVKQALREQITDENTPIDHLDETLKEAVHEAAAEFLEEFGNL